MKWNHLFTAALTAFLFSACSKNKTGDEAANTPALQEEATLAASVTTTFTDESSFVASLSSYGFKNPSQVSLNRVASASGYTSVYGFNIPAANRVKGFKWNSGDEQTQEWMPQGITGFQWGGKNYLLVTWYAVGPSNIPGIYNQHKGVRIALVDITNMSNITYRLALLVQDVDNRNNPDLYKSSNSYVQLGSFAPVTIHAGGVAYYDEKIYVVDTKLGIRVFDLNKFVACAGDPTKNRIGREADGTLKAFDYGFVLPQTGYYKITNAKPFSCISLGQGSTASDKRLWTGQYIASTSTAIPKVHGFSINTSGAISTAAPQIINPIDKYNTPVYGMQGVYRAGTKTFMATTGNSSYEGSTARLVRYNDGTANGVRYRWPHGAEDLYLEQSTGYLWNLTEYPTAKYGQDNRCVFAVRLSDYD